MSNLNPAHVVHMNMKAIIHPLVLVAVLISPESSFSEINSYSFKRSGSQCATSPSPSLILTAVRSQTDCVLKCSRQEVDQVGTSCFGINYRLLGGQCELFFCKPTQYDHVEGCSYLWKNAKKMTEILPEECSFPFTYNGHLLYSCVENVTGVTNSCSAPFGCIQVNRTEATCFEFPGEHYIAANTTEDINSGLNITVRSVFSWLVIQSRQLSTPPFNWNLTWASYREGFGIIDQNFWLGLETVHRLTSVANYRIRFELQQNSTGLWYSAEYWSFSIGPETDAYRISIDGYSGDAGNSMQYTGGSNQQFYNNGMRFTTLDVDNDNHLTVNCAPSRGGGWWYNSCYWACTMCDSGHSDWTDMPGPTYRFITSRMMIKLQNN